MVKISVKFGKARKDVFFVNTPTALNYWLNTPATVKVLQGQDLAWVQQAIKNVKEAAE